MPTNPYFNSNWYSESEQDLLEDLIIESIQQYGLDMYYLPREFVNYDQLFGEDKISKFEKAYKVEFYVNTIDRFGGEGEILTKFGLELHDEMSLIVSVRRFSEEVVAKVEDETLLRPREGDIVFFAQDNGIFEITFVEEKPYFFQLGKIHTWELRLRKIDIGAEKIKTGIPEIDKTAEWAATLALILGTGTGEFLEGEQVTQGDTEAEVVSWNPDTKKLVLIRVKGTFVAAANIVGTTSAATWTYPVQDTTTYLPNDNKHNQNVVDNEFITDESETVVDDSEGNPLLG